MRASKWLVNVVLVTLPLVGCGPKRTLSDAEVETTRNRYFELVECAGLFQLLRFDTPAGAPAGEGERVGRERETLNNKLLDKALQIKRSATDSGDTLLMDLMGRQMPTDDSLEAYDRLQAEVTSIPLHERTAHFSSKMQRCETLAKA